MLEMACVSPATWVYLEEACLDNYSICQEGVYWSGYHQTRSARGPEAWVMTESPESLDGPRVPLSLHPVSCRGDLRDPTVAMK